MLDGSSVGLPSSMYRPVSSWSDFQTEPVKTPTRPHASRTRHIVAAGHEMSIAP